MKMSSSSLMCCGYSYGDISTLRLTPIPDVYRCPVSTPANFIPRAGNFSRSKTLQDMRLQHPTAPDRIPRSPTSQRRVRNVSTNLSPKVSTSFEICFVDKHSDIHDTQHNTWLRSLCAQPVDEILSKYRRKSSANRPPKIWSQTFTTPGEKSLIIAWEKGRDQKLRSQSVGVAKAKEGGDSNFRTLLSRGDQRLSYEHKVTGTSDSVRNDTDKIPSLYVKNITDINCLHLDESRHPMKTIDTLHTLHHNPNSERFGQTPYAGKAHNVMKALPKTR